MKSSHSLGIDSNFKLGLNFYKSFFPSIFSKFFLLYTKKYFMTYDVTASYIGYPCAQEYLKHYLKLS